MVRAGQRVERIVEYDVSRRVDQRYPQFFAGCAGAGDEGVGGRARIHGVEHPQVEKLQLRVEPLGLEVLFAPVLEKDETPHQRPRKDEQQQEQPPVVGKFMLQSRSHSPGALRCVPRKVRLYGAGV